MAHSLEGHVALVTGSTTGLGKGIAQALGTAGAKVGINYFNNTERAEKALAEFEALGAEGMIVRGDVSTPDGVADVCGAVASQFGPIDILVPNATPDQPHKPIEDYDWEFYQQMIDFFIKSPFLLTKAILPGMKEKKWGRIINITSEVYHRSVGEFSGYVAAKGGQIGWSRSMATELAPFGITVNTVSPGWIPTERHDKDPQEDKDAYFSTIPAGRWGTPQDVGEAVRYYASEEASFITGQTLCVNGGLSPW
ncbi:MAG: 3-oxoacyl-ACP reductase FabG [Planctomycetota bacterium]|nr:MAG: 3-oxoacyl-ACP reductase FabG [Planctomycetota bacterium]REJ95406.1 MAG: 3-oxoacyl-ACP reductase FabG [Planctomycetota bacterium]REK46055.1 MAG: 3-oxoacyl-ACP reductase FabG [Planctomycetota bacterium]